jgi:membrane-associated phospholipid phosphatase
MATGNHFWLDVLAGVMLATISLLVVYRVPTRRVIAKLL